MAQEFRKLASADKLYECRRLTLDAHANNHVKVKDVTLAKSLTENFDAVTEVFSSHDTNFVCSVLPSMPRPSIDPLKRWRLAGGRTVLLSSPRNC